jgi:hypothetical protein
MPETQAKVTVDSKEIRASTLPRSLTDDYRKKLGELIELEPAQRARLKKWIKARIDEWVQDTDTLHRRLEEDNDLVEGVVMETDFPFEGASNVHVPVTEMYMEVYKSVEKRSILGADLLWYGETDADELKDLLEQVENMMNYKARNEWNIEKCLANVFWTTNRDGLGILQITWSEEYESAQDVILITGPEDFAQEFPSAEEAGKTEEEFVALREQAATEASPEFPLEVPITFENQTYYGCKGEVVELIDFVTIPATVPRHQGPGLPRLRQALLFAPGNGSQESLGRGVLRGRRRKPAQRSRAAARAGRLHPGQGRHRRPLALQHKDDFEFFELVVKGRLDGDDEDEEKYLVTWSHEHDELMQVMVYPYRVPFYALFRINERPEPPDRPQHPSEDARPERRDRHAAQPAHQHPHDLSCALAFKALDNREDGHARPKAQAEQVGARRDLLADRLRERSSSSRSNRPTKASRSRKSRTISRSWTCYLGLRGCAALRLDRARRSERARQQDRDHDSAVEPPHGRPLGRAARRRLGDRDICLSHLYQFGPPILEFQEGDRSPGRRPP